MKVLTQNKKMKLTSGDNVAVYNFGIPAFRSITGLMTCPKAGVCASGCYAKSGAYLWKTVKNAYEKRLELTQLDTFTELMSTEIQKLTKKSTKKVYIRIHDSGDFYNDTYLSKWLNVMSRFPNIQFYAYTKMVDLFKGRMIPKNFQVIYSLGGKLDTTINQATDRHSKVFQSELDLINAGYVNASKNDLLAIGENKKIGLVYHGAKNYTNTLWNK